jgi:hypothetical protein
MALLAWAIEPRTQPRDIVQDFVDGIEAIIALEHDDARRLPREGVIEQIERGLGDRVGMGILEERPWQEVFLQGDAARHMYLLDGTRG